MRSVMVGRDIPRGLLGSNCHRHQLPCGQHPSGHEYMCQAVTRRRVEMSPRHQDYIHLKRIVRRIEGLWQVMLLSTCRLTGSSKIPIARLFCPHIIQEIHMVRASLEYPSYIFQDELTSFYRNNSRGVHVHRMLPD